MTLDALHKIRSTLIAYGDFASHNGDGDESGIMEEMNKSYSESMEFIHKEIERIIHKNALARAKRKVNKTDQ